MAKETKEEVEIPVPGEATLGDVLDAVRELTETMGKVVESLEGMRKEYALKTRAGIFDQKGVV